MQNPAPKTTRYAGIMRIMRSRLLAAGAVTAAAAVAFSALNRPTTPAPKAISYDTVPLSALVLSGTNVTGSLPTTLLGAHTLEQAASSCYDLNVDRFRSTQLQSFAVQDWQAEPYLVEYASSDPHICTVNGQGLVSGMAAGTAIITATAVNTDGQSVSSQCSVTVNEASAPLTAIALNRTSVTLRMGGTGSTLAVSCTPVIYQEVMPTPVYSSSDESICTVDENGHITAVAPGSATVTAAVGTLSASCAVTVLQTATSAKGGIQLLSFDHSQIASIGNQTSGKCSLYALRYARTVLDGSVCGSRGMWSGGVIWSAGGYSDASVSDLSGCLSTMYSELNAGRPVIVHLQNTAVHDGSKHVNRVTTYEYWETSSGWNQVKYPHITTSSKYGHWVCVVGYREGADPNNLQESDFYALDPARCTDGSSIAVTNLLNGTVWVSNSPVKVANS